MSGSHTKALPPLNGLTTPSSSSTSSWNNNRSSSSTSFFAPSSSSSSTTKPTTSTNSSSIERGRIPGDPVETPLTNPSSSNRRTLFGSGISPAPNASTRPSNTHPSSASLEKQMALFTAQSTSNTTSGTTTATQSPSHTATSIPFGIRQRRSGNDGNRGMSRPPSSSSMMPPPPKASRLSTLNNVREYRSESGGVVPLGASDLRRMEEKEDGNGGGGAGGAGGATDNRSLQPNQTTNETPLLLNSSFLSSKTNNTPSTSNNNHHNNNNIPKQPPQATKPTQSQSSSKSPDYTKWIVVYGFTNAYQNRSVLNRFESFGTIVEQYPPMPSSSSSYSSSSSGEPLRNVDSNWVCLRYESDLQAEKALCQHGSMLDATTGRHPSSMGVFGGGGGGGTNGNREIVFIGVQRVDMDIAVRIGLRNYVEFGIRSIGIGGGNSGSGTKNNNNDDTNGGGEMVSSFQKPRVLMEETDVLLNGGGRNTNGNDSRMVGTGYSGSGTNVHGHPSGLVQYFLTWMFSW